MSKYSQIRQLMQYLSVCGCMLAIALAVVPVPTLGFELPKYVALSGVATLCAYLFLIRGDAVLQSLLGSIQGKLLLSFMGVCVVSLLWSVAPLSSLLGVAPRYQGILTYLCVCIVAIAALLLAQSARGRTLLHLGLLCSNVAVVLYATMQMLHLDPLVDLWASEAFLGRVFSTLGHPNMLGQFIVLTAPFVALALIQTSERMVRLWWLSVITLNMVVVFGTVSRSALLGMIFLIVLCLPSLKKWLRKQRKGIKTEQAIALSFVVVLCSSIGLLFFVQRFESSFELGRSTAARQVIWDGMWSMIWQRPFGWGLDALSFTSPKFIGKEIYNFESLTTVIDRAHNEPLQLLVGLGPLGFIVFFWLVGSLLWLTWKTGEVEETGMLRAAGAGVSAYLITVLFGFPSIATLAFFWLLIGIMISLAPQRAVSIPSWADPIFKWLMAFVSVVALIVSLQWAQARWVHAYARILGQKDPAIGLATHQEGLLTFGYDRESIIEVAQAHLIALEQNPEQESLQSSVQTMIGMLRNLTSNRDGTADILEAWLYATQGNAEESKKALHKAEKYFYQTISYHRAAQHIYALLADGVEVYEQQTRIRGLLPDAYFVEDSELRRILRKQHPWLETL